MIAQAISAGVPFAWFTVGEAYRQANYLQAWLEERDVSYVVAIRRSDTFTTSAGEFTASAGEQQTDAMIAACPARA